MWQDRSDDALGEQLIQVHVLPGFFFRTEPHGFGPDWHSIVQADLVIVPQILHFANICLFSRKAKLIRYQAM